MRSAFDLNSERKWLCDRCSSDSLFSNREMWSDFSFKRSRDVVSSFHRWLCDRCWPNSLFSKRKIWSNIYFKRSRDAARSFSRWLHMWSLLFCLIVSPPVAKYEQTSALTDHHMRQGPSPDVKYDWTYLTSFDQICFNHSVKTEE